MLKGDWIACQGYMYSWRMKWPSHNITSQLLELNNTASGNLWALWAYTLTVSKLRQTKLICYCIDLLYHFFGRSSPHSTTTSLPECVHVHVTWCLLVLWVDEAQSLCLRKRESSLQKLVSWLGFGDVCISGAWRTCDAVTNEFLGELPCKWSHGLSSVGCHWLLLLFGNLFTFHSVAITRRIFLFPFTIVERL